MTKKLLLAISIAAVGGCAGYRLVTAPTKACTRVLSPTLRNAIVRLHNKRGAFVCSGTVIDSKTILTAAHCASKIPETFDVRDYTGEPICTYGVAEERSKVDDLMLIKGDFSNFETVPVMQAPSDLIQAYSSGSLVLCGYPRGGKLYCQIFSPKQKHYFSILGYADVYPGMSGGPLLDGTTGKVVGCLSAALGDQAIISPTIELDALFAD